MAMISMPLSSQFSYTLYRSSLLLSGVTGRYFQSELVTMGPTTNSTSALLV